MLSPCSTPTVVVSRVTVPPPHRSTPRINLPLGMRDNPVDKIFAHVPDVEVGTIHFDRVLFEKCDKVESGILPDDVKGSLIDPSSGRYLLTPGWDRSNRPATL